MTLNVISQLASAIVELSTIVNICKYRRFHEGHHFILMAMDVHGTPMHDMNRFIKECAHFFHDKQMRGHLSLSFCIQFFKQHVSIGLKCVLTFAMEKKIALVGYVCSKPPITIRFHDLHACDIKRAMGEPSYHERD
jgi:hypothetical protein